jgi:hypothetical protein
MHIVTRDACRRRGSAKIRAAEEAAPNSSLYREVALRRTRHHATVLITDISDSGARVVTKEAGEMPAQFLLYLSPIGEVGHSRVSPFGRHSKASQRLKVYFCFGLPSF